VLIEISQGFKTFEFIKSFIRKLFQTSHYYLKDFFEKTKHQNIIILLLLNLMQACLQRIVLQNLLYSNTGLLVQNYD
jgi:hypothetical protein